MAMDAATIAKDLGVIWIFIEATTIASAMLVNYYNRKSSLEAAWKYLFICSVGIALAFAGILLLVISQPQNPTLLVNRIDVAAISPFWLKDLVCFHPDRFRHQVGARTSAFLVAGCSFEAPAPISALLSGALLNVALIPILRVDRLMRNSGLGEVAKELYLLMGFLSVFIAAVFVLKTKDFNESWHILPSKTWGSS